ncbi:MAG: hypothetical protein M3R61_09675, partial [Chloroflexota bacterium]|nr:hypothetical protein [Chloroflexota bacterium]
GVHRGDRNEIDPLLHDLLLNRLDLIPADNPGRTGPDIGESLIEDFDTLVCLDIPDYEESYTHADSNHRKEQWITPC